MNLKINVAGAVKVAAETAATEYGCRMVDLSFKREKDGAIVKLVIDGDNVTLDACAEVSRKFSEWLDAHESEIPFNGYTLEVSSPGPERPLVSKGDFERFLGKAVLVVTKSKASDGRKRYRGKIESVDESSVTIYIEEESTRFVLKLGDISKARLEYEF